MPIISNLCTAMEYIRLGIADDHPVLIEGFRSLFKDPRNGIELVLAASNGRDLLNALEGVEADVVLLDLNMRGGHGLDILPDLRELYPELRVVIFTMYENPKFIKFAFKLGAMGYILKIAGLDEVITGVRSVMRGEVFISNGLSVYPGTHNHSSPFGDEFLLTHSLTKREMEILLLIAQAKSNKEIAEELYISDQTVIVHRKNLMRKLNITNSAGLTKFVIEHNLLAT